MSDTRARILDTAQALLQRKGYNGFSYADIAGAVQIKTATIHYYFKAKEDLGLALVEAYAETMAAELAAIDASLKSADGTDALRALEGYAQIFRGALADRRHCLCGMLSAEALSLPARLMQNFGGFFGLSIRWLSGHLEAGRAAGALAFSGDAETRARQYVAVLEGAMLLATADRPGASAGADNGVAGDSEAIEQFDRLTAASLSDLRADS